MAERAEHSGPGSEALRLEELPELHEPLLVCAFAGWNDAGQSATGAVRYLVEHLDASRFARIDPEEFYVFTDVRPTIRLVDGERELDWPSNDFHFVHHGRFGHDLVLMPGIEPNMHWREYTGLVLDLARRIDARMVITLGGLLAGVAHTVPVPVTGTATHPEILANWIDTGVRRSRYEGPTGIVGVLGDACRRAGMPSASIWANVPHYLSVSPNPKTVAALVHRVNNLLELDLDLYELDRATEHFERQVEEAVARDPDVQRYVHQLEQSSDDEEETSAAELPSGAALVEDLEEFLRRQREGDDDDDDE